VSDPLDFIGTAPLGIACGIALLGVYTTGRVIVAVGPADADVKPIRLEAPRSTANARRLVEEWERRGALGAIKRWVYADFPFLIAYALAIAAAGSLAARASIAGLDAHAPDMTKVGALFTYMGLAAGVLDAVEDVLMLAILRKRWQQPIPAATTAVSAMKWILVGFAAIGSVGLLIASAFAELI
jgi:hypothetical protein